MENSKTELLQVILKKNLMLKKLKDNGFMPFCALSEAKGMVIIMKKITDRFWLGVISGVGGNMAKMAVEEIFNKIGFSKTNGYTTAAGIFLKKSDVSTPYGKAVGMIADNMIAVGLGVNLFLLAYSYG